jgi:hypothetical protein
MLVWAVFGDISEFEENPAAVYAAPFIMDDGAVLARVNSADWSGETLTDEAAIALIHSQPEAPMKPPPEPHPGPGQGNP